MLRPTLVSLAYLYLLAFVAPSSSRAAEEEDRVEKPTISVSGTGRISAAPDIAEIHVGVHSQAETAQKALASSNEVMNAVFSILKEQGVAAKDMQTTQIQVSPQYSQPGPRGNQPQGEFIPRIVGYGVDNTLQITARKIDKLGVLLDALVQAGANQIHSITFRIDHPEKLLAEARKKAMAEAKQKAELLAGEAGVVVGFPLKIVDEVGQSPPPSPRVGRAMMMAAAPVPIAGGEQELAVTVHVVYELKRAK